MILPILTVPNPLLNQKARPVRPDEFGQALLKRMTDMAETMYAAPGVGLAGPQVGDLRRILVCDLTEDRDEDGRREKGKALFHMVNPEIVWASDEQFRWEEGCLSVPEFWEYFERPRQVRIRYQDPLGEVHEVDVCDYPGVIVQHEMDHLEGVTLLDRVSRLKKGRYLKKVKKWQREQERVEAEAEAW
jgi:peptide deformylase